MSIHLAASTSRADAGRLLSDGRQVVGRDLLGRASRVLDERMRGGGLRAVRARLAGCEGRSASEVMNSLLVSGPDD